MEHLFVLKILSHTQRSKNNVGISLKPLHCRDTFLRCRVLQQRSAHFSTAEPSKGPKKANNKLNSTWNMTRCKLASFFLFSLHLLHKDFRILPVNVIRMVVDLARVLSRIRACAYAEGSAL